MTDQSDPTPYCVEGCGRPATTSRPMGITADGTPTVELTCERCTLARANPALGTRISFESVERELEALRAEDDDR